MGRWALALWGIDGGRRMENVDRSSTFLTRNTSSADLVTLSMYDVNEMFDILNTTRNSQALIFDMCQ